MLARFKQQNIFKLVTIKISSVKWQNRNITPAITHCLQISWYKC